MTELDLYKFINDNDVEWHRQDNDGASDIIIFPSIYEIGEFNNMVKSITSDEGIKCIMKDRYFAIWMNDICEHYGIDIDKVFIGEKS